MSELRKNPLTGEWVLLAENRKNRPYDFLRNTKPKAKSHTDCPFCGGNEARTTEAVFQNGTEEDWSIRVFPNMFPAVSAERMEVEREGFYEQEEGVGRHEVLVDTPKHFQTIDTFTQEHLKEVLVVLSYRLQEIRNQKGTEYVQIFKNCGADAGMSLQHSHWQIVGLPIASRRETAYYSNAKAYRKKTDRCIFCDMIAHEKQVGKRVVVENENFVAFTPFAPKFSYELWIGVKKHCPTFADMPEEILGDLAEILWKCIRKVAVIRPDISYNICFMDAPKEGEKEFHWYLQILPRLGGFAGFEYATETYINPVSPEKAARYYRGEE